MISDAPASGAWDSAYHAPVLVDEVVRLFNESKTILDCTLGGGGHSAALLALGAHVTAIDRDPAHAFAIQQKFVADMMASVSPEARRKLSGLRPPT